MTIHESNQYAESIVNVIEFLDRLIQTLCDRRQRNQEIPTIAIDSILRMATDVRSRLGELSIYLATIGIARGGMTSYINCQDRKGAQN